MMMKTGPDDITGECGGLDWCRCRKFVEGLQKVGNSTILKGVSWVEQVGQSHMAVENIGELWRMFGQKFYVIYSLYMLYYTNYMT